MDRRTFRLTREDYPEGSAYSVVVHGLKQVRRGRKPAMSYKMARNPREAYKFARRDATFYLALSALDMPIPAIKINTMIYVDREHEPATYKFLEGRRDVIAQKAPEGLEIESVILYLLIDRVLEHNVTDLVQCFEDLLDTHYLAYNDYILRSEEEYQQMMEYSEQTARDEVFRQLTQEIFNSIHWINDILIDSCIAPRILDASITPN